LIDISVIIVNYRGWKDLDKCLCALELFGNEHFSMEVIVVDNCSNDGRLPDFQMRFSKFKFVLNTGNNGFSNGCNLGAASATGKYLLFMNPDIVATDTAVLGLLLAIQSHPEIMMLSCTQVNLNSKEEQKIRFFPSFLTLNGIMRAVYRRFKQAELLDQFSLEKEIIYPDWVSGSLVMISKENFEKLGGWDDSYWLYYEDVDLCFRAQLAGGKVALLNKVSMIHHHGGATRINYKTKALTKSEVTISLHIFLSKHFSTAQAIGLHLMVISEVLIFRLIPAILGLPLFFIKKLNVYSRLYVLLINYYLHAIVRGSWLSTRSVKSKL